jgi:hypothetical protein
MQTAEIIFWQGDASAERSHVFFLHAVRVSLRLMGYCVNAGWAKTSGQFQVTSWRP